MSFRVSGSLLLTLMVALTLLSGCLVPDRDQGGSGGDPQPTSGTPRDRASHVVVAVVDTGINPYHDDFRDLFYPGDADLSAHPATYISGYPADAVPLALALNATTGDRKVYDEHRKADAEAWDSVKEDTLYWVPGTKIIGAYSTGDAPISVGGSGGAPEPRLIIDDDGHGTASASVAVGNAYGTCPECLVVAVEGSSDGLEWAASQPWIDIITNSWGNLANLPVGGPSDDVMTAVTAQGKTILFAAGNGYDLSLLGPQSTYTSPYSGPVPFVVVGAGDPNTDSASAAGGKPVDVVSWSNDVPAAHAFSIDHETTFSGTSSATPIVAGVFGSVLLDARERLGDTVEGPRNGSAAQGVPVASAPLLADGNLTREELESLIFHIATPSPVEPNWLVAQPLPALAPEPVAYLYEGWGIVSNATIAPALAVLKADQPMPERPDREAAAGCDRLIREILWGGATMTGPPDPAGAPCVPSTLRLDQVDEWREIVAIFSATA